MTYFSRVPLNKARIGAQKLLTDGYKMHAAVEACFPPGIPTVTEQGRLLYRVIDDRVNHSIYLYVVSPEEPDFTSSSSSPAVITVSGSKYCRAR